MACPYFLLSRYDFSCLRQRRLESDAEDRRRDCRCRRNHSSLPQRKLESDADTVETTNSVCETCSDSQIDPLKSRITARWSVFLGKILHRFSSLSLKSRITLAASPFCRRNHSPLRQRRLEPDAEDRRRHAYCRRNHSSLRQRRPNTFPTSKNFYSTAFAPRCNLYNFTELNMLNLPRNRCLI